MTSIINTLLVVLIIELAAVLWGFCELIGWWGHERKMVFHQGLETGVEQIVSVTWRN